MTLSKSTLSDLSAMPDRLDATFRLVPRERWSWQPPSW